MAVNTGKCYHRRAIKNQAQQRRMDAAVTSPNGWNFGGDHGIQYVRKWAESDTNNRCTAHHSTHTHSTHRTTTHRRNHHGRASRDTPAMQTQLNLQPHSHLWCHALCSPAPRNPCAHGLTLLKERCSCMGHEAQAGSMNYITSMHSATRRPETRTTSVCRKI